MRRASAAAVVVLASLSIWGSASAAPSATSSKPVLAPLLVRGSIEIEGVGCGVPMSAGMALPADVLDVHVQRPKVGARDHDARITKVVVRQTAVMFTAVADGDLICDPDRDATPPASRRWSATFDVDVVARRRVVVGVRAD